MTPVGFEPTISAGERPKTYALDHAAAGTGTFLSKVKYTIGNTIVIVTYQILIPLYSSIKINLLEPEFYI